ncbi:hypothetical protein EVAR_79845_1 [Eumeta japonica]|uniref:Uncharacterized protein n=1 Tax=Eumeta variegata TaxID=151549 RepID=A0A4C1U068_EUMVA|nr:hypothetical protein EVAR_79845_1 [Eumeta japonica]
MNKYHIAGGFGEHACPLPTEAQPHRRALVVVLFIAAYVLLQRTKLCCSGLPANVVIRSFNTPRRPVLLHPRVSVLRRCYAFATNFTPAEVRYSLRPVRPLFRSTSPDRVRRHMTRYRADLRFNERIPPKAGVNNVVILTPFRGDSHKIFSKRNVKVPGSLISCGAWEQRRVPTRRALHEAKYWYPKLEGGPHASPANYFFKHSTIHLHTGFYESTPIKKIAPPGARTKNALNGPREGGRVERRAARAADGEIRRFETVLERTICRHNGHLQYGWQSYLQQSPGRQVRNNEGVAHVLRPLKRDLHHSLEGSPKIRNVRCGLEAGILYLELELECPSLGETIVLLMWFDL